MFDLQGDDLPEDPPVKGQDSITKMDVLGIPAVIHPTLSRYLMLNKIIWIRVTILWVFFFFSRFVPNHYLVIRLILDRECGK